MARTQVCTDVMHCRQRDINPLGTLIIPHLPTCLGLLTMLTEVNTLTSMFAQRAHTFTDVKEGDRGSNSSGVSRRSIRYCPEG